MLNDKIAESIKINVRSDYQYSYVYVCIYVKSVAVINMCDTHVL